MFTDFFKRFCIILLVCIFAAGRALAAQEAHKNEDSEFIEIDLGERESGEVYDLNLGAQNIDCDQAVDFKFSSDKAWVQFPDGQFVRQVGAGQTKMIDAKLDLSYLGPGEYIAIVDVDCENCGVLIFKNCQIDKQRLRLRVQVVASVKQLQALNSQSVLTPPTIDYNDKRIPRRLRNDARKKYQAWKDALAARNDCIEKLAELEAAAKKAKENAAKADMAADTAEQDVRNAKAHVQAAKDERKKAIDEINGLYKTIEDAEKAVEEANDRSIPLYNETREEAIARTEKDLADAKAAQETARQRLDDARKNEKLYPPKEIRRMEREAERKRKDANAAAKKATNAQAALDKKRNECLKLQEQAVAAQTASTEAETKAKAAIPGPPPPPTQDDVKNQEQLVWKCARELGELMEAQRLALELLGSYGALGDDYESDLKLWGDAIDDANEIFESVPPGLGIVSEWASTTSTILTTVRAVIGVAKGVKAVGNKNRVPRDGNDVPGADEMKRNWVRDGFARNKKEADLIYEQMKLYTKAVPDSTELMQKQIEHKKNECKRLEDKLTQLEDAVKKLDE